LTAVILVVSLADHLAVELADLLVVSMVVR
jgi:hypothetical protein